MVILLLIDIDMHKQASAVEVAQHVVRFNSKSNIVMWEVMAETPVPEQ
jgi:hypothetical protein